MNLHKITYSNGVTQYKNLIKHEDYLNVIKPIQNEIYELECKNYKKFKKQIISLKVKLKSTFGEEWFTDKSPLGLGITTGLLVLPKTQGGTTKISVSKV